MNRTDSAILYDQGFRDGQRNPEGQLAEQPADYAHYMALPEDSKAYYSRGYLRGQLDRLMQTGMTLSESAPIFVLAQMITGQQALIAKTRQAVDKALEKR